MSNNSDFEQMVLHATYDALAIRTNSVPVGISNRHVHLCRKDMDILFGTGSELTEKKMLLQPGQFAADECVNIVGPKGKIERVRVIGPLRKASQVEISMSDGRTLGITPPVRESGNVGGTPGIIIEGPKGTVEIKEGVIAALRHIHLSTYSAEKLNIFDGSIVNVQLGSRERGSILGNVLVRVSDAFVPEMHIDIEEANALGVCNNDAAQVLNSANM